MIEENKKKIAFLIPALNEEKAIPETIKEINKIKIDMPYEIYIVDGGSKDRTVELATKGGAKVIKSKKGYGRQYKLGIKQIDCDYIITGDADCTYPFETGYNYLKKYIINENYDFLNTNRFAKLNKNSMSLMHSIGNKILTLATNLLFNLKLRDSQSGMWIFKKEAYNKLYLTDNDMAFSEEIKIEAFKKLKAKEVPISYKQRVGESKLNYGHAIKNFLFLFKKKFVIKNGKK